MVTAPPVVMRPIEDPRMWSPLKVPKLANHSAPPGPAVIDDGWFIPVAVKLVTVPVVVIRPIEPVPLGPPASLVNHSAPSGPAVMALTLVMPRPVKILTAP